MCRYALPKGDDCLLEMSLVTRRTNSCRVGYGLLAVRATVPLPPKVLAI